ncbi:bifunctional hydroxymethylpyrimidine kinase/phosphomethylpyrimidine kinase [Limnohabitans sp. 2KL-27]|jgi:hydroxymethylpyrimidine/phosphomethylpyrimidine kinase|uniref:bifunctional hydroxymethylpyrimidine kinase/phosphomethylpyrimidine kinase n=1 Tax=Limnohabitans sp. 2KL-27 TaxID=1100705 RepID=UPI000A57152B|nr:bifunctional hydroxymethylpyrimidine kinase/phosphomethylpyrimidine kinase [Limnohabitans sp. 2KL-27]
MSQTTSRYPRLLTIAGSDSGGGAGIQADIKTFSALGCYGMSAITALTAQNTIGVRAIHAIPPQMLREQIDAVVEDIGVDAVKIGMLHAPDIVQVVAEAIDKHQLAQVVLDPVMIATSGAMLIENEAVQALVQHLFHRVQLITPNLDEAGFLVGHTLKNEADMEAAADQLLHLGARAVLIKGGHLSGDTVADLFVSSNAQKWWLRSARIHSPNTHGTGCTLSSAIAAHLALGVPLQPAIEKSHAFIRQALQAGANVRTGSGSGPLNHLSAPVPMHIMNAR